MSYSPLECKDYVKYLGILIDKNLIWKGHIDLIALKIGNTIGMIAKLSHFNLYPFLLLSGYISFLFCPFLTYGISTWGQASQSTLDKLLLLQKRAIRLITFFPKCEHAIPFLLISISCPFIFFMSNLFLL